MTIRQLHKRHKEENPDSPLGERAIRDAVKNGELSSLKVGSRAYVEWERFNEWLRGK